MEKKAGKPIRLDNLSKVVESYAKKGLSMAAPLKPGESGTKKLMSVTNTAKRLNANLPKELHDAFQAEQLRYFTKKAENKYLEKIAGPVSKFVKGNIATLGEKSPEVAKGVAGIISRMGTPAKRGYLSAADKVMAAGHEVKYPHSSSHIKVVPFPKKRG